MIRQKIQYSISQFYRIKFKFIRFLLVGGINTLFSLSIYWILIFFGLNYALAVFISNMLGILFNFKTTGKLVFESNNNQLIYKFFTVYLLIYLLSIGGLKLLFLTGVDKYSGAVIIAIPMAVISFLLNRKFVFKKQPADGLSQ